MLKRATARSKATATTTTVAVDRPAPSVFHATDPLGGIPQDELIERVRLKIPNAHVFKLPPKPSSGGWRGADWRDKVWQGTLQVVERGEETAVLLVDAAEERNIFAVCPIRHNLGSGRNLNAGNGVDRCIDSSRYFVLRIQNAQGRHMFIGLAFNERNDAFDFNTALEDSRREKEVERRASLGISSSVKGVDYKMKEGEKIHVSIPKIPSSGSGEDVSPGSNEEGSSSAAARRREARKSRASSSNNTSGGFLKPSSKDTPSRLS
mmetsp:Transcript_17217/g.37159  ORF Transcript_17217/g.37159 Transcript_17217/m.37159 type:complete len:264 (+) Transcript_17217:105-896(+)|eukprot:CAMPEP_0172553446 /NCGR_PEP_ID=MMETSP1067-20121228/50975_1 /TAXON_ID=265564 ORGANISM="Thalassiosira punctigera, Strain Tpunct2005C2" /NCGR_SAMPLE_ID=MMETSP1067 /ASSEMBLY_ACC=CAM_ASM_000444 /LENGTH=263 /DNA_ID=CAMNT_0013341637 /DNA_START=101 /DNA_END=892 /DNA_ORIENTATION=+